MARRVKTASDYLLDLVAIPSVSSMSNRPVIEYVLRYLDSKAWITSLYPYNDAVGIEKVNLVAITQSPLADARGYQAGVPAKTSVPPIASQPITSPQSSPAREQGDYTAELALVCHTDTVPFDPAWKEAVNPRVRNGKLYGRGSCDVKGYLACILDAVSKLDIGKLSKPLAILLTADEEIGCVGAKYIAGKAALRTRYAIIGEPTGLRPVRAGKGYALGEVVVRGKEAHSAFPERGHSAISDAARVILKLEKVAKKLASRKNAEFDPPFTTLNVGLIQGGTAKNIIPGECRITVEWRPVPGDDPNRAAELIRLALAGFDARFDVKRMDPAFDPSATDRLASLVESLARRRSTTVSFGTEAAHLRTLTSETIVFGPGNMETAHKSGEFVPTAELTKCSEILRSIITSLCL